MTHILRAILAAGCLTTSSCSYVARDLRHTGGAIGGVLDDRMFDASGSKDLVLLRGAILIAMVARAGTVYSRDRRDADAYVNYMVSASEEISFLAGHIRVPDTTPSTGLACGVPIAPEPRSGRAEAMLVSSVTPQPRSALPGMLRPLTADSADKVSAPSGGAIPQPASSPTPPVIAEMMNVESCATYQTNFESDLPMLERRLFRLAMAALPQEQAKRFLDQVTTGNAIGAAMAAFSFSLKALDGLHSGAAVHRTGLELIARQHNVCIDNANASFATVRDASLCMGLSTTDLFVGKHDLDNEYRYHVRSTAFHSILKNIQDSCRMVNIGYEEGITDPKDLRSDRNKECNRIIFEPRSRWATRPE